MKQIVQLLLLFIALSSGSLLVAQVPYTNNLSVSTGAYRNVGSTDVCWKIRSYNTTIGNIASATVCGVPFSSGWIGNTSTAKWISLNNPAFVSPPGSTTNDFLIYEYDFGVGAVATNLACSLYVFADGDFEVELNGHLYTNTDRPTGRFLKNVTGARTSLILNTASHFNLGAINTIRVKVYNSAAGTPMGLNIDGNITSQHNSLYGCQYRSISGRVLIDHNGNGIIDGNESTLADDAVIKLLLPSGQQIASTVANGGVYTFSPPDEGPFDIKIEIPQNASTTYITSYPNDAAADIETDWHRNVSATLYNDVKRDFAVSRVYYKGWIEKETGVQEYFGPYCLDYKVIIEVREEGTGNIVVSSENIPPNMQYLFNYAHLQGNMVFSTGNYRQPNGRKEGQYPRIDIPINGGTSGGWTNGFVYTYDPFATNLNGFLIYNDREHTDDTEQELILRSPSSRLGIEYTNPTNGLLEVKWSSSRYNTKVFDNVVKASAPCCPEVIVIPQNSCTAGSSVNLGYFAQSMCSYLPTTDPFSCYPPNVDINWTIPTTPGGTSFNTFDNDDPMATTYNGFTTVGIYRCTLNIDFGFPGCGSQTIFDFEVFDGITNFSALSSVCLGATAQFNSGVSSASLGNSNVKYEWKFGDGNTSSAANPTHTYSTPGKYQVEGKVMFGDGFNGCTMPFYHDIYVYGSNFNTSDLDACVNSSLTQFSFLAYDPSDPANAAYLPTSVTWNFGDNTSTSSAYAPVHAYTTPGTYVCTLDVDYGNGCSFTQTKTIRVYDPTPIINIPSPLCFDPQVIPPAKDNIDFSIAFNANNPSDITPTYNWNVTGSDGVTTSYDFTSIPNTVTKALAGGTYLSTVTSDFFAGCGTNTNQSITLENPSVGIAVLDELCEGEQANFAIFNSVLFPPQSISWNFGDNTGTSTSFTPSYTYANQGDYDVTVTTTTAAGCTATSTSTITVAESFNRNLEIEGFNYLCLGTEMQLFAKANVNDAIAYNWDFGNGASSKVQNPKVAYTSPGTYTISVNADYAQGCVEQSPADPITVVVDDYDFCSKCSECIGSFAPAPGERYVVSAWVKEAGSQSKTTYKDAAISFFYEGASSNSPNYLAKGPIVEGWQQIEEEFVIPSNTSAIQIELLNLGNSDVFFDDIRIYPFNANLKSFVYDPITMRLTAELDERNYATFYEYDEDGNLIRVKKETERGIKTIQETIKRTKQND